MSDWEAIELIERPITNASLFYAYYYLSEIEGVQEVEFDLAQKTDKLSKAFWNYGVYALLRELDHFAHKVSIDDSAFLKYVNENNIRIMEERVEERVFFSGIGSIVRGPKSRRFMERKFIEHERDSDTPMDIHNIIEVVRHNFPLESRKLRDVLILMQTLEDETNILDRKRDFIKTAKVLFDEFDWGGTAYGGPAWADICSALLQKGELSDVVWVDMMWAVEHNNKLWLDKINWDEDETYIKNATNSLPKEEREKIKYDEKSHTYVHDDILNYILDQKREGNFGKIAPYIIMADGSLSRYREFFV